MKPTAHLRFIERYEWVWSQVTQQSTNELMRVLQQWWSASQFVGPGGGPDGCKGEWRDVPMEWAP